jgi:3-deoxy-manno-octulosonate cytidylyltransferase (CMP-KDO synthetase)
MKIIAVIPARMASVRFPRKILFEFLGLPMIEHVRRRALLSNAFIDVYVATCDEEVASVIRSYGGKVIMTSYTHTNGTSRVAEAIKNIDCTHVVLLQGDEPLLLPDHINQLVYAIKSNPQGESWNATGPIENDDELDRHSFVKCAVSETGNILFCFRRSPAFSSLHEQKTFIRKILGLIAFRKEVLQKFIDLPEGRIEKLEYIEQMRLIEYGFKFMSVSVSPSLPSVNELNEAEIVLDYLKNDPIQIEVFKKII